MAERHDVSLITFSRQYPGTFFPGRTQRDESRSPFRVPHEPLFDSLSPSSWKRVGRRIAEQNPDAVVFQWWQPFFAPAYRGAIHELRKHSDLPVFFLCHNLLAHDRTPVPGHKTWERLLTRSVFRHVDGFLVHANEMVGQLKEFSSTTHIRKIYHPLYNFYLEWDEAPVAPTETEKLRLLFFGKIRKYKGLSLFLEALALIKGRIPFEANIAGEFYVAPAPYRKAAERLGLSDNLTWRERYIPNEEVPGLFRRADLVVLPYLEATQSGVVPVAYQFEVPVIASDVGGLSEVVLEGRTGYLVPSGNSKAIAERIIQYYREGRKPEFQENIRDFRQRLSWNQVVDSIEDLSLSIHQGASRVHE
jgi:glycosyltransferase involved in cell wall biosynthesis